MEAQENLKLREYQEEDIEFIRKIKHVGLFNEQRTGKTVEALIATKDKGRVLVLCPAYLIIVWQAEIIKWIGCLDNYDIYSYETIRGNENLVKQLLKRKHGTIIIDEAHKIKNRKSLTYKAVNKFHAEYQLALTGTPAQDKPWDVWNILHWLYPKAYSSFWNFIDTYFICISSYYCSKSPSEYKPKAKELIANELNKFCINRKYADVLKFNEDIDIINIKIKQNSLQKKAIEGLKNDFEYDNLYTKTVIDTLQRIRQICNDPSILGIECESPKIKWLYKFLDDYKHFSVIILSDSTMLINNLRDDIYKITGKVPNQERNKLINEFQSNKIKHLAINTAIGSEGLTLDNADFLIFIDLYPPASRYIQAKARIKATIPERVKHKTIIRLILEYTYDEELYALVDNNCKMADVINSFKKYLRR